MPPSLPTRSSRLRTASRIAIAAAVVASVGGGYLAWQTPAQATAPAAAPPAMPVSVAAVLERQVAHWDKFSGRLEAIGGVEVRSQVAGTIDSVHFSAGSMVKKGDTLIVIDPRPYQAEVARAEAAVAAARARLALTGSELRRARALLDDRAIAQREFDAAANAELEAQAALQGAQAALQTARLDLGYTRITAPIAGRVGRAEVTAGNLVPAGAGGPVLTSIVSVSPIYATFEADERSYLKYAAAGRAFRPGDAGAPRIAVHLGLADEAGHPREGVIESVDNHVDARSGTIRLRAVFDNRDGSLTPGLFARLKLAGNGTSSALLVSERAIGTDQHKRFVWVLGDAGQVAYREVKLGPVLEDGLRVVRDGLKPGERIVVNGLQRVRPGVTVAPTEVAMHTPAGGA
jgi:multidrug efflux system membrane fusion protein